MYFQNVIQLCSENVHENGMIINNSKCCVDLVVPQENCQFVIMNSDFRLKIQVLKTFWKICYGPYRLKSFLQLYMAEYFS